LKTASVGFWVPALVLPLYYLADSTITLLRRLFRGEKIWRAHREHYYQRALTRGLSHAQVVYVVLASNAALISIALFVGNGANWLAIGAAAIVVATTLWFLGHRNRNQSGNRGV